MSKRIETLKRIATLGAGRCATQVFQAEYNLVCDIASSPIPYLSICDGVWMGLGVGIAAHGDIRIVTERTLFAMPEISIGLWPDVGFAYLAAHMPGTRASPKVLLCWGLACFVRRKL
jgi:enoyl-CoA hydratase/carnithine racemase